MRAGYPTLGCLTRHPQPPVQMPRPAGTSGRSARRGAQACGLFFNRMRAGSTSIQRTFASERAGMTTQPLTAHADPCLPARAFVGLLLEQLEKRWGGTLLVLDEQ